MKTLMVLLFAVGLCSAEDMKLTHWQLIPLMETGKGFLATLTVINTCRKPQSVIATVYNQYGAQQWDDILNLRPGQSWSKRFDGDPTQFLFMWGVLAPMKKTSCLVTISVENNRLHAEKVNAVSSPGVPLKAEYFTPRIHHTEISPDCHGGFIAINASPDWGILSFCTELASDATACYKWQDVSVNPNGIFSIPMDLTRIHVYAIRTKGVLASTMELEDGTSQTFSANSSITFSTR